MKALKILDAGENSRFEVITLPRKPPGPLEIEIRVEASGVNRIDSYLRRNLLPDILAKHPIPGAEVAGTVERIGEKVSQWNVGDSVAALIPSGGYSEFVCADESVVFSLPDHFSFIEMAAVPEVFTTAFQLLCWIGKAQKDEWVVIHAASSGVGTAAIQLAKKIGLRIITTSRNQKKCEFCKSLGADFSLNLETETYFSKTVGEITSGEGTNLVLDCVGKNYFEENLKSLRKGGRLVQYGALSGAISSVNLDQIIFNWIQITGTTLQPRSTEYKAKLIKSMIQFATPYFKDRSLTPIIHKSFPIDEAEDALLLMEGNQNLGKIILTRFQ